MRVREPCAVAPRRPHVHVEDSTFRIVSATPVADVLTYDLFDFVLPGILGRYVLPEDAMIQFRSPLKYESIGAFLAEYEAEWAESRKMNDMQDRLHHLSVAITDANDEAAEEEEESADEEECEEEAAGECEEQWEEEEEVE